MFSYFNLQQGVVVVTSFYNCDLWRCEDGLDERFEHPHTHFQTNAISSLVVDGGRRQVDPTL